jgi:tetratricopeptide (TPR) repeat protein
MIAGHAFADTRTPTIALSPQQALEKLSRLDAEVAKLSSAEAALIDDARDGSLDRHTLGTSCLVAGGLTDAKAMLHICAKLNRLEKEARAKISLSKAPAERATALLKFLHEGPMKGGFRAEQTDIHVVLETGEFNCVSSAALYTIVGRRIGLNVQAVEVPEHMFVLLADGDRKIDVEATDPNGFDPDPKFRASAIKGFPGAYGTLTRRVLNEPGLASVVAFNHAVALAKNKKFANAVRADLIALALDSTNPQAHRNVTAHVINWSAALIEAGTFSEAADVLSFGRELSPRETALVRNTQALFDAWANVSMRRNDWATAIRRYEAGLKQLPGDSHLSENLQYCRSQLRQ